MAQGLGGNPFGPAGTGKTETVKALGQQLGRLVLVFNCDEAIDVKAMTRILVGLLKCGAWGCFDEFNRLSKNVLSALSTQIHAIQSALQSRSQSVCIDGFGSVNLNYNSAMFITLNPMGEQYKGRNQLPENLTALFAPVAMTVPDNLIIARVLLLSEGFDIESSQQMGEKIIAWFDLARDSMSLQKHYDWGLRAIKSCLNASGRKLRSNLVKDPVQVVVQSLRQQIKSKLVEEDEDKFDQLIEQIFGISAADQLTDPETQKLYDCLMKVMEKSSLTPDDYQVTKAVELNEQLMSRLGVVVLGESGVGKTTILSMLSKAKRQLQNLSIEQIVVNPKAMQRSQLLGHIDEDTREWQDGVLPLKSRQVARSEGAEFFWIVLDGDIEPEWVEALNSVLDDNQVLTLPSGERIDFDRNKVNIIFEATSLQFASPATISRLGIILVKGIRDMHVMRSALNELNFPTSAEDLMKTISWPQPKLRLSDTKTLISQIRFSLTNRRDVSTTLGHFQGKHTAGLSLSTGKIGSLIVTPSVSKVIEFITAWISGHESVILVGSKGVGKNAILEETFFPQGLVVKIFCTPDTTSSDVIRKMKECCSFTSSSSSSRSLRANNGAKLILYFRHLELLKSDEWGSVSVIAFLTSLISQSGFYDESSLEWVSVQNFIVICTCTDIDVLEMRFLNRVHVSEVSLPPLAEFEQIICGLTHPSLPEVAGSWRTSFAAFFCRVVQSLVSGDDPQDSGLDVMRICIEILSNICRYEGVPDQQIMQFETRRILINYCQSLKDNIDSLFKGSGFSQQMPPADSRLYPYASGFGNRLSLWSQEKFKDAVIKSLTRYINETESFIYEIGLIPEMLDVFAVAGFFLSDPTPGIQTMLFVGSSASGRKLSLRVIAHDLGYDLVWSPRAKISEKHLMNELRNFTESVSDGLQQQESLTEERRILILLDSLHFIAMPFLLKHLLTFYWEETEKRRERRATSTSSAALVIRIGIMRQRVSVGEDLLWSRFARVTLVPDYSSQSLRILPAAIDPAIDVAFSEKFYRLCKLFPSFARDKRRFLSLILSFKHLFQEKKVDTENRRKEFVEKIAKLESTSKEVAKLKEEANDQKEVLAKKRKEADDALGLITSSMTGAEDQRIELEVIRSRTENEAVKLKMRKKEIDEELSLIEPALQAAKAAVGGIKSESLSEIRSLRAPPEVIRDILEGVLRIMGLNDTSWVSMKSFLARRGVKEEIINFDARKITPEMSSKVEDLLRNKPNSFEEKVAKRASAAAAPLATWVVANLSFARVLQKIKPLEDEQNKLESGLRAAQTRMKSLSSELQGVESEVGNLKERLNQVTLEAAQIEVNLKQTAQTLAQSESLVRELSGEYNHWKAQLNQLDQMLSSLSARCLVSAAVIIFMGRKNTRRSGSSQNRRQPLQRQERQFSTDSSVSSAARSAVSRRSSRVTSGISLSSEEQKNRLLRECCHLLGMESFDVKDFLGFKRDEEMFLRVKTPLLSTIIIDTTGASQQSLSSAGVSAPHGISSELNEILSGFLEKSEVTSFKSRDWPRVIELALRFGRTVVMQSFDQVDLSLLPILKQQSFGSEGARFWTFIGEKRVDLNQNFHLYFVSCNPFLFRAAPSDDQEKITKNKDENYADRKKASLECCRALFNVIDFSIGPDVAAPEDDDEDEEEEDDQEEYGGQDPD